MSNVTLIDQPAWILVANAEEARIYEYVGPEATLIERETLTQKLPKNSDPERDERGQNKNQQMPGGETYAPPTDPRTHEKESFAKDIAAYLFDHHQKYDRLVVVAAPAILGMLRDELHKEAEQRIVAEIDKNLSPYDTHELPELLDDVVAFDRNAQQ